MTAVQVWSEERKEHRETESVSSFCRNDAEIFAVSKHVLSDTFWEREVGQKWHCKQTVTVTGVIAIQATIPLSGLEPGGHISSI